MSSRHAIKVAQAPCLRMSTPVYYLNAAPAHTCAPPCYVMLVPGCGMVQHGSVPVLMRGAHVCGSGTLGQGGGILPVEQIVHVVFGAYDRLQQYPNWKQILDSYVTRKKGNQFWRDMYRFPETCPEDYRDWFNNLNYHQTEDLLNLALRWSNKHRPDSGVAAATPAAVGDLKPLEQIIDVVWFKVPYPHEFLDQGTALVNIVKKGFMICPACYNDELQIGWIITKGTYGDIKKIGDDAWVSEIQRQCPPDLADHLKRNKDNISNKFVLSVQLDRCNTWSKDGALLLGDAAHTMNPVGAQGINCP